MQLGSPGGSFSATVLRVSDRSSVGLEKYRQYSIASLPLPPLPYKRRLFMAQGVVLCVAPARLRRLLSCVASDGTLLRSFGYSERDT